MVVELIQRSSFISIDIVDYYEIEFLLDLGCALFNKASKSWACTLVSEMMGTQRYAKIQICEGSQRAGILSTVIAKVLVAVPIIE